MADQIKLGVLIDEFQHRDAIHIAVAPVVAAEPLKPGQHVGFVQDGDTAIVGPIADGSRSPQNKAVIGIVDPFLTVAVKKGDRFYLFLYPQTITSLRHEWTHPAFGLESTIMPPTKSASVLWIKEFADELDQTYNRLMDAAQLWVDDEDYTFDNSERYKRVDGAKWPIFWRHFEVVTGTKVKDHNAHFFTCSC